MITIYYPLKKITGTIQKGEASFDIVLGPFNDFVTWICINLGLSPNMITLISLIFFLLGAFFFLNKLFFLGAIFCLIRYALDNADGKVARLKGMDSKFGAIFDTVSSYIGTALCILALLLTWEKNLIFLIAPFLLAMFFLFPLQMLFLRLFLKEKTIKMFKEVLDYEDARNVAFIIIPILYPLLRNLTISLYTALVIVGVVIILKQFLWIAHYHKDFKRELS